MNLGKIFAYFVGAGDFADLPPVGTFNYKSNGGPGRVTMYTHHKKIGRSKYMPHQGKRECARRRKQMGV